MRMISSCSHRLLRLHVVCLPYICDSYASEYNISPNAEKSQCLVLLASHCNKFRQQLKGREFVVGNKLIEFVYSFSHLGHLITSNFDDCADIMNRCRNFIGQVNNVLCYFGKLDSGFKDRQFQS